MNDANDRTTLALHGENLEVGSRKVTTGTIRVTTSVQERQELVEQLLRAESYEVERVSVGRKVDHAPPVREEDGTIIIPVLEEVLVIEKRLVLKEEIRLRRTVSERTHRQAVTLRSEEASVSRLPSAATDDPVAPASPRTARENG